MSYPNNIILTATVNISAGSDSQTTYEWKINGSIVNSTGGQILIETSKLNLGDNIISVKITNGCGKFLLISKTINITEVNIMEKTETIVVSQPVVTVTIVLQYTGTVEVTVNDGVNPVAGATLDLDGVSTGLSTGADGKATIPNVAYGTHTVTARKVMA